MAFDGNEQSAIIELMHGKYQLLLPIEAEWGIRLHEGDMRPRIEHFHDAVRAFTSGEADIYAKNSRLSVENLAYDLGQLRQIGDKPLGYINRATEKSASTQVTKTGMGATGFAKTPPQAVRAQIVGHYRDYTVFFAAIFAEVADHNFTARSEVIDNSVSDLGLIEQVLNQLIAGKMTNAQASGELMHVERDDLRERVQAMLAQKQLSAREKQEALAMLGKIEKGLDKEKKALESSHMSYATGQLAVYEDAKETVKRLANQGLNLAGKFVDTAMQAAQKGKGQGRSQ
jgi:hypothetical protein